MSFRVKRVLVFRVLGIQGYDFVLLVIRYLEGVRALKVI